MVAPRIVEIEPRAREDLDAVRLEGRTDGRLIVDDESEVAGSVGRAAAPFAQRQELIAQVE